MTYNVNDSDGAQALDYNQLADRLNYAVDSGCSVSINSGTLGQADTLTLASGSIVFDGAPVSVSSQSVQIDAANASDPRKDVVYLDSSGTANVANGTPEAAEPASATRFETYRPAPLDLSATQATVVAEVWVPAGASSITSSDLRDRRVIKGQSGALSDSGTDNADGGDQFILPAAQDSIDLQGSGELQNAEAVSTDSLQNNTGDAAIQTSFDGLVVPISPGLGMDAAIDPSATTTPISDARDSIVNNGSGKGTILYPPETITEGSTYSQTRSDINHIGWGSRTSVVEFTDLDADGYVWDGAQRIQFDGITISGSDMTNRTAGHGCRFTGEAMTHWSVGQFDFQDWGSSDSLIYFDTGHLYSSVIRKIRGDITNQGTLLNVESSIGPGMTILNIRYSPDDSPTVISMVQSDGVGINDTGVHFGDINIGGSAGEVMYSKMATNGYLSVGRIADFGTNNGSAKQHIVQLDNACVTQLGPIRPTGKPPSYDYYVMCGPDLARDTIIYPIKHEGTLNNTAINAATAGGGNYNVQYFGPGSDITNNTGNSSGNTGYYSILDGAVQI